MAASKISSKQYKVLVNSSKAENKQILEIAQGAGDRGQPARIKAQVGVKYQLEEVAQDKNVAPQYVKAKRVGKDLHITFEGDSAADLIIEDYYSVMPEGYNAVVGQAENGAFYEYLPEDPSVKGLISELTDGAQGVNVALGGQEVQGAGAAVGILAAAAFNPLAAVLGVAGAAAAAAGGAGGTSGTSTNAAAAALSTISAAAQADNASNSNVPVSVFATAGVSGVDVNNVAAIQSALNSAAVNGVATDTVAEVQAVVDAYKAILAEANDTANTAGNSTPDANTGSHPTAAQYAAIGVDLGAAATDAETLGLFNAIVGGKQTADVDTVAEVQALANIANAIQLKAAGGSPSPSITVADLTAIGLDTAGVTVDNLPTLLSAIAAKNDNGTETDTLEELQALITALDKVAPVGVNDTSSANENTGPQTGNVKTNDSSLDNTEIFTLVGTNVGTYGTLVLQNTGAYTYTYNAGIHAITGNVTDTFTYRVTDAAGNTNTATLAVTVTPVNDAATFSGDISKAISESNVAQTVSGQLNITDIDSPATVAAQTNVAGSAGLGHFTISQTGAWTYVMDNAQNQLTAGQVVTDSLIVTSADNTTQVINALITGTNDAPVLDAAQSPALTSVSSSAVQPVNGNTTAGDLVSTLVGGISDADTGSIKGIAITGVHTGGTLYYTLDGGSNWLQVNGVSDTNALLLAADSNTRVFYQANGTGGTITDAITFRAWDMTTNTAEGVYKNTAVNGGSTEFSSTTDTVSVVASLPMTSTIDLGTVSGVRLNLIKKVTASNGKVYYHVDTDGNNLVGGNDAVYHNQLDTLFNGGADTTGASSPTAGVDTERSVIVNGYTLVLPTVAEFAVLNSPTSWSTAYGWSGVLTYHTSTLNGAGWHYDANNTSGSVINQSRDDAAWLTGFVVEVKVPVAPVVLDLNRDGTFSYSQVAMDVDGSKHLSLTSWAGAQDGVLVWDKLGDGVVHDNTQYAFGQYATSTRVDAAGHNRVASDLDGLSDAFDTNHDGKFNAADAQFGEFKIWQDVNQNGVSDAGEVRSLADWGITEINLVSDGVQRTPVAGVTEAGQSTAALADGTSMQVADALFAYNALDYTVQTVPGSGEPMQLLGSGMTLDLSCVVAAHRNLTAMDLTGQTVNGATGANSLKLNLSDVLGLPTTNGVHQLTVTGDANDTANVDLNEWLNTGATVTQNGHSYAVYSGVMDSSAQLLIDQHMVLANHVN